MTEQPKRRRMKEFKIQEISVVDKPAQEGALAVLIKRREDKPTLATRILKQYFVPSVGGPMEASNGNRRRSFSDVLHESLQGKVTQEVMENCWPLFAALDVSLRSILSDVNLENDEKLRLMQDSTNSFLSTVKEKLPKVEQFLEEDLDTKDENRSTKRMNLGQLKKQMNELSGKLDSVVSKLVTKGSRRRYKADEEDDLFAEGGKRRRYKAGEEEDAAGRLRDLLGDKAADDEMVLAEEDELTDMPPKRRRYKAEEEEMYMDEFEDPPPVRQQHKAGEEEDFDDMPPKRRRRKVGDPPSGEYTDEIVSRPKRRRYKAEEDEEDMDLLQAYGSKADDEFEEDMPPKRRRYKAEEDEFDDMPPKRRRRKAEEDEFEEKSLDTGPREGLVTDEGEEEEPIGGGSSKPIGGDRPEQKRAGRVRIHGKNKMRTIKVGGRVIRKSDVGSDFFDIVKAQQQQLDQFAKQAAEDRAAREHMEFAKVAERDLSDLPGTVNDKARLLRSLSKSLDPNDRRLLSQMLRAGNGGISAAFRTVGHRGDGLTKSANGAGSFTKRVSEIRSRDRCGHMEAMTKARREYPEEFDAFQGQ